MPLHTATSRLLTAVLSGLALAAVVLAAQPGRAIAGVPDHADAWNAPAIAWQSIGDGIRESSRSGRPVIMLFHTTWCPNCKRYREVFKDPEVVALSRDFVMILIDADKDKVANGAFAPDGTYVPRTLFLSSEGDVQSEIKGATDPQYPHTIDASSPSELVSLMRKAKALMIQGKAASEPAAGAASGTPSGPASGTPALPASGTGASR
jgi:thiol-disulfide isomerase/thioredoxin